MPEDGDKGPSFRVPVQKPVPKDSFLVVKHESVLGKESNCKKISMNEELACMKFQVNFYLQA